MKTAKLVIVIAFVLSLLGLNSCGSDDAAAVVDSATSSSSPLPSPNITCNGSECI